jgi:hypothetical protein
MHPPHHVSSMASTYMRHETACLSDYNAPLQIHVSKVVSDPDINTDIQ